MSDLKAFESALESKLAEQKAEVASVTEKAAKAFDSKVEQINEQMEKSNKTLGEALSEIKEAKAAFGKLSANTERKVAVSYADHVNYIKSEIGAAIEKGWNDIKGAARNGGKGFAAARGHLDQRFGLVGGQAFLKVLHGLNLRGPQLVVGPALPPLGNELRHVPHVPQEGGGLFIHSVWAVRWRQVGQPLRKQLGSEKRKHAPRTGLRVQPVGELGFYPGGLEQKGQRSAPGGQGGGQALGVTLGLNLNPFESDAFFFGLNHTASFAVHIQQVVCYAMAGVQGKFAQGDPQCGMNVGLGHVADVPSGRKQQIVNQDSGAVFGFHFFWATSCLNIELFSFINIEM
jgi:uncharacterized protein YukE